MSRFLVFQIYCTISAMTKKETKIIVVLGQTATGKSDLAVHLAKKFRGEVISADSRQVYKGMDIGTGKITKKEMKGVPHHLLDVLNPKNVFSVADFQKLALHKIREISKHGKVPIIAGGTGFYIDSILYDVEYPSVKTDKNLRKQLSKKPAAILFKILKRLDPRRAKEIDQHNPRRLIRAIELAKFFGQVPIVTKNPRKEYEVLKIGVRLHPEILKAKIKYRLLKRINKGMLKEVSKLHENGLSWKRMRELGLEYKYISLFLEKKINRSEMIEALATAIWRYAKRQMTWFKRDPDIKWFDPSKKFDLKNIEKEVAKFLK